MLFKQINKSSAFSVFSLPVAVKLMLFVGVICPSRDDNAQITLFCYFLYYCALRILALLHDY